MIAELDAALSRCAVEQFGRQPASVRRLPETAERELRAAPGNREHFAMQYTNVSGRR